MPVPPPPDPAKDAPRAAAFFDLDKTLMAGSSGLHWARAAAAAGLYPRRVMLGDVWRNVVFRLRGSTDESTRLTVARAREIVRGQRVADFQRLAPQVLAGLLPRLYPRMLEIAWEHQDAGRRVYVATASTQETADLVATVLAFDGAIGARSVVVDGRYTGDSDGPFTYREGKASAVRALAEREGIDLAASWAYSDSESDLPMLRAVGHPVAVNPDAALERVARAEGWEVLRFERLGRRLALGGALASAAVLGGAGHAVRRRSRAATPR